MVNGGTSSFFKASCGIRQGDPLSPLLFIIVIEAFSRLLERAKELNMVKGVLFGKKNTKIEVLHLFFADDAIIFCQPSIGTMLHLRCILLRFQIISGLKINMAKSELVKIGDRREERQLVDVLGCRVSDLPLKYLGLPLGAKFKDSRTWDPVVEMFERRLAGWKRNFLSKGGRLTLIKSTLANLPIYYLSMLAIPSKVAKKLETIQCRFL